MSWWAIVPPAVLLTAAVYVPGWAMLRLAGVRGLLALGGAPAVTSAVVGVAGVVLDLVRVPWSWWSLGASALPLWALAALLGLWVRGAARRRGQVPGGLWSPRWALGSRGHGDPDAVSGPSADPRRRGVASLPGWVVRVPRAAWVTGALLLAGASLAVPIGLGMQAPDAVHQQWDAIYHATGVQVIRDTGNASSLGAFASMYGEASPTLYYPAVWHALVSLLPGSVALGANSATFVFGVGVWLVGLAALGRVLGAGQWSLAVWVPLLGTAFGAFPAYLLSVVAQWPFGSGIALVPGVLALVVAATGSRPGDVPLLSAARGTVTALIVLTAVVGVGLMHGSAFFSLLLLVGPLAVARWWQTTVRWWRTGHRVRAALANLVVLVGGAFALRTALDSPIVQTLLDYERETSTPYAVGVLQTLIDFPFGPVVPGLWSVAVLTVVGIVALWRDVSRRWLIAAWALVVALVAIAAGPESFLQPLAGVWYTQATRIRGVYPVIAAPIAAYGLLATARWVRATMPGLRRRRDVRDDEGSRRGARSVGLAPVAAGVLVLAFVGTGGFWASAKTGIFEESYVPEKMRWGLVATDDELAMIRRMAETTPPGSIILGDPASGAALSYALAHRWAVFPHLGSNTQSADQRLLRGYFNELNSNPEICAAVNRLGATHFYQDTATAGDGAKIGRDTLGLRRKVKGGGLEVVDQAGTATLYRITAC